MLLRNNSKIVHWSQTLHAGNVLTWMRDMCYRGERWAGIFILKMGIVMRKLSIRKLESEARTLWPFERPEFFQVVQHKMEVKNLELLMSCTCQLCSHYCNYSSVLDNRPSWLISFQMINSAQEILFCFEFGKFKTKQSDRGNTSCISTGWLRCIYICIVALSTFFQIPPQPHILSNIHFPLTLAPCNTSQSHGRSIYSSIICTVWYMWDMHVCPCAMPM